MKGVKHLRYIKKKSKWQWVNRIVFQTIVTANNRKEQNLAEPMYHEDAKNDRGVDWSVCSVDLQKVIMLPRMPGNKTAIIIKRIVAYHETFAPLGSS